MLKRLSVIVTTAILCLNCSSLVVAATKKPLKQPKPLEEFPVNPLEIQTIDPLLPHSVDKQPLTPIERQKLEIDLDDLNQKAAAKLAIGDKLEAFTIWNRELRLRRVLGSLPEVNALSRVGMMAWRTNTTLEVQLITQRLQKIQQQVLLQKTTDLNLLQSLGAAYQQVRSPKDALIVYNQILTAVRSQGNATAEAETLLAMAQVHLSWFDYPQAAATYEQLLTLATAKGDRVSEVSYLQELAFIYEQAKQPEESVKVRSRLAEYYTNSKNQTEIPGLKLAIGSNYESLAKTDPTLVQSAFKSYQEAYQTAWGMQQYARAADALRSLIALYRQQGQRDEAINTSQILIQAEVQATDTYGLMNTYDQLGQMHVEKNEYPQALEAFQRGLELAQQLNYQQSYFTEQIQKVSQTH